jgi:hypothetical protein
MAKKQLNIDSIKSELSEGSAFFPSYKKSDSPAASSMMSTTPPVDDSDRTRPPSTPVQVVRDVPLVPPTKRV